SWSGVRRGASTAAGTPAGADRADRASRGPSPKGGGPFSMRPPAAFRPTAATCEDRPMTVPADITDERIALLVDRFYARVRRDPWIGPVFEAAVEDWPEHLALLTDFWSS